MPFLNSLTLFSRHFRAVWSHPVNPADEGPRDGSVQGVRLHRVSRGRGRQEGYGASQRLRAGRQAYEGIDKKFSFPVLITGVYRILWGIG